VEANESYRTCAMWVDIHYASVKYSIDLEAVIRMKKTFWFPSYWEKGGSLSFHQIHQSLSGKFLFFFIFVLMKLFKHQSKGTHIHYWGVNLAEKALNRKLASEFYVSFGHKVADFRVL
jgi:hypothetical protein